MRKGVQKVYRKLERSYCRELRLLVLLSVVLQYPLWAQSSAEMLGATPQVAGPNTACKQIAASKIAGQAASARSELLRSRTLANAGDLAQAEQAAERSLQMEITADGWYQIALVRFGRNDARCSLAAFTAAAALRAPRGEDLRIVALDYVLLNDPADAEKWLHESTNMDPVNAEAWYDLGRVLYSTKRFAESADVFRRVITLFPKDVRAETYLGLIAETDNDSAKAEAVYRKAIADQQLRAKPWALPYRSLGVLLRDSGRLAEAEILLQRSVVIAPEDPVSHAEFGLCLAKQRRWTEARSEFVTALRIRPSRPAWHFQLGRIDRELGLQVEAHQEFLLAKTQIEAAPEQGPEQ